MEQNKKYGLFTAITMIAGIVIGSGIFFKADDVLRYTQGNVSLGVIAFIISAIAIVFGSLTISQLAMRTDKPGGIIAYAEEFINPRIATAFGWYQTFLYFGTLIPVVSYVAAIYICSLFGIEQTIETTTILGFVIFVVIFGVNVISAKLGGIVQNIAMIIKLIPLILIAVFGIIFGEPASIFANDIHTIQTTGFASTWMTAFVPLAFSFDGWIVATSIGHEIKNSKKNLPLALICSPIIILICYLLYFVGINSLVGPDQVFELGNASADAAASMIFGDLGAKFLLICVIISVLGTLNGLTLGVIRMPYSLALRKMFPASEKISRVSTKLNGMPVNSAILVFVLVTITSIIRYFVHSKFGFDDISEIFVSITYLNLILLYVAVFRLALKGEIKNKFMGYIVPILAIVGSIIFIIGAFTSKLFIPSLIIAIIIIFFGYFYFKGKEVSK